MLATVNCGHKVDVAFPVLSDRKYISFFLENVDYGY